LLIIPLALSILEKKSTETFYLSQKAPVGDIAQARAWNR